MGLAFLRDTTFPETHDENQEPAMLKRLRRSFAKCRPSINRLWNDDAGTAGVLTPSRSFLPPRTISCPKAAPLVRKPVVPAAIPPQPTIWADGNRSSEYQSVKRAMDIVGSLVLLVLLSPILLSVLAILMVATRGKPFFGQERVGHCGRRFRIFKFRTMRLDADKLQHLVQNEKDGPIFKNRCDPRVTRLGRWLRKISIDEMPQLVNVLLGDMALVGPRPPVPKEVAKYKPWQRRRLAVKPGLTCLWQVSGRSDIGFEDWVRLDIWYIRNQTLWNDVKLLVRTPLTVITCKGAY
jgi:lipopolysaccharide/colanic/teichoic acid biosynthesis glycosyltransferase